MITNDDLKIVDYSVEDIAKLIIEKRETVASLNKKRISSQLNQQCIDDFSKKIQIVESRLIKSLDINTIILCILFPSRKILGLFNVFDPHCQLRKGYKRRVNQFYFFSIVGSLLYLMAFIFVINLK